MVSILGCYWWLSLTFSLIFHSFFKMCTVGGDLCSNMIMMNRQQCFIFPCSLLKLCFSKKIPPLPNGSMNYSLLWNPIIWFVYNTIYLFINISLYVFQVQDNRVLTKNRWHTHNEIICNELVIWVWAECTETQELV